MDCGFLSMQASEEDLADVPSEPEGEADEAEDERESESCGSVGEANSPSELSENEGDAVMGSAGIETLQDADPKVVHDASLYASANEAEASDAEWSEAESDASQSEADASMEGDDVAAGACEKGDYYPQEYFESPMTCNSGNTREVVEMCIGLMEYLSTHEPEILKFLGLKAFHTSNELKFHSMPMRFMVFL